MHNERLQDVLEQCRQQRQPELSADLVAEVAVIELRYQFVGDNDRKDVRRDLEALLDEEMQRIGHSGSSR